MIDTRQHVHDSMAPLEDEQIGEEERRTVARSKEWFEHNQGTPFEDVVTEMGFSMEQIRNCKDPD